MKSVRFSFGTFLASALVLTTVDSLRCFQCNSAKDSECVNLKTTDIDSPYYMECNRTSLGRTPIFCRKTILTFIDTEKMVRVTRSCGWEVWKENVTNCLEADSDFKFERSCQCFSDGCNAAPHSTTLASKFTLVVCLLSFFIYRLSTLS